MADPDKGPLVATRKALGVWEYRIYSAKSANHGIFEQGIIVCGCSAEGTRIVSFFNQPTSAIAAKNEEWNEFM